jgi:hypothetical protein
MTKECHIRAYSNARTLYRWSPTKRRHIETLIGPNCSHLYDARRLNILNGLETGRVAKTEGPTLDMLVIEARDLPDDWQVRSEITRDLGTR